MTKHILSPHKVLRLLMDANPRPTSEAPKDSRGIYGLIDHVGDFRYIGSTSSAAETFYRRIHQRHRTGSEDGSHYFSRMYNTGRMWRLRNDPATKADGDIAKSLRNEFIARHCKAVWIPLPDIAKIADIEAEVIALAPDNMVAWNRRGMPIYDEPVELVDKLIESLSLRPVERAALNRQRRRQMGESVSTTISKNSCAMPSLPTGPFQFFALDVETANNDRSSICQVGVACVRPNNFIETWVTLVDPQTNVWLFSGLHGVTDEMVSGAPVIEEVIGVLDGLLKDQTVYQHSGFDRSAVRAACANLNQAEPQWNWRDSVSVARRAWPELKGKGGHGLASLKAYLGLDFEHHDAGEDARAAAEVVLLAKSSVRPKKEDDTEVLEDVIQSRAPVSDLTSRVADEILKIKESSPKGKNMLDENWFMMRPQKARAFGRPVGDGFLVRKGSTAMLNGSPLVKRDRDERDRLVRLGVLVPDTDPDLYRFDRDHLFGSASVAGGVVKDGNCSGPQSWCRETDGRTLKETR